VESSVEGEEDGGAQVSMLRLQQPVARWKEGEHEVQWAFKAGSGGQEAEIDSNVKLVKGLEDEREGGQGVAKRTLSKGWK
jgi:hypothetical protein